MQFELEDDTIELMLWNPEQEVKNMYRVYITNPNSSINKDGLIHKPVSSVNEEQEVGWDVSRKDIDNLNYRVGKKLKQNGLEEKASKEAAAKDSSIYQSAPTPQFEEVRSTQLSKDMNDLFQTMLFNIVTKKDHDAFLQLIDYFKNFDDDFKREVTFELSKIIEGYKEEQDKRNNEKICEKNGHIYGKWHKGEYTTYEYYREDQKKYPVAHEYWERTCKICGNSEQVNERPKRVIASRLRKTNQNNKRK
jgi:hypothetical protein